ncbi:MAG: hypothetical protein AB2A00_24330 [Myxococcota bacterium]
MESRRRAAVAVGLLTLVATAARVALRARGLEGFDSVGFAQALHSYDLTARTPHFPGYPVYILVARVFSALGFSDVDALILPGALGSALLVPACAWTAWRLADERAAVVAALLTSVMSGLHLAAARPLSEGLGVVLLGVAGALCVDAYVARRARSAGAAGVVLGLMLGVRLAWLPAAVGLAAPLVVRRVEGHALLLGGVLGVLGWAVPMTLVVGWGDLLASAERMLTGHFTSWGGSVASEDLDLPRLLAVLWGVWAHGLGGPWSGDAMTTSRAIAGAGLLLAWVLLPTARRHAGGLPLWGACAGALAYLVVGANPDNPRHVTQLLVPLVPLLGIGLTRIRAGAVIVAGLLGLPTISVAVEQATVLNPAEQSALFMATLRPSEGLRFYGWTTMRTVRARAPLVDARLVETLPAAVDDLRQHPVPARTWVFFDSRLKDKRRKDFDFTPVETFRRSPYVDPAGAAITIYRYQGERQR